MQTPDPSLIHAIEEEGKKFQKWYVWLKEEMPEAFFKEIPEANLLLITHSLMDFELQDYYSVIHLKGAAIVLTLDLPNADLVILENYARLGIRNYQTFISKGTIAPTEKHLRIAHINFFDIEEESIKPISSDAKEKIHSLVLQENPQITYEEFEHLLQDLGRRFLAALSFENIAIALAMYFRAKTRDSCQYEVRWNLDWEKNLAPSMQIVLAWRNTPTHQFLFRLARIIYRHKLVIRRVDATHINPYSRESILIMAIDLHGADGRGVEESADIPEFLREFITVKYFPSFDSFDKFLVSTGIISGNFANVLRAMLYFIHQALVHIDPNLYTLENITEGLLRHPDLTAMLADAFKWKFHPALHDFSHYLQVREKFLLQVEGVDTGQEEFDQRRKIIFQAAMNMIHYTLKTNAYRMNFTALSFRLDPHYLQEIPFDWSNKFPEIPFAIFFIKGLHFFGFHIRFRDLARGGLRTVFIEQKERVLLERNHVFTECYSLAYTQQLKNKDIPEGGAKGIIFLRPFEDLEKATDLYRNELSQKGTPSEEIEKKISLFRQEQTLEYLHQSQRAFVENLVVLVNDGPTGELRAHNIVDYWKKPEYLYLGPDENMHDAMIQWIASYSKKYHYKPGTSFISGKPKFGINHKAFGVTSLGVNVYLQEFLKYIGIDPTTKRFTLKMVGGPDGDVAGNQILNLYKYYPNTAKLLSLTDVSGTIYDPEGLDLETLCLLFKLGHSISHYPLEKLSDTTAFLVNKTLKNEGQQIALLRKKSQEWISIHQMNHLIRENSHRIETDVFIPAGGRPRTLNDSNFKDFLNSSGAPTSRIIIEGANLYLTAGARRELEKRGCLIVRDSSANKTGVICSSFEVLAGLTLGDELFYTHKEILVKQILERLKQLAYQEASLLIQEHRKTDAYLTDLSAKISERINLFTDQLLAHLEKMELDPLLIQCYLHYALPILQEHYQEALLKEIPDLHKKAIIASHIASQLVYKKGLQWWPSVVDILPIILEEMGIST